MILHATHVVGESTRVVVDYRQWLNGEPPGSFRAFSFLSVRAEHAPDDAPPLTVTTDFSDGVGQVFLRGGVVGACYFIPLRLALDETRAREDTLVIRAEAAA